MNKFCRKPEKGILGGVCAGFADLLSMKPNIVRLIFVAGTLFHGGLAVVYILLWIFTPKSDGKRIHFSFSHHGRNSEFTFMDEEHDDKYGDDYDMKNMRDAESAKTSKSNVVAGVILIVAGGVFLAKNFMPNIDVFDYWPLLVVGAGVGVLVRALRSDDYM